jgi:hypothetical protein
MGNLWWEDIPATTTQGDATVMRNGGGTWEAQVLGFVNISFVVPSPLASRGAWITRAAQNLIIKRIDSCTLASTVSFNIEIHSDPTTSGTNVLSTDQTASTTGASDTSFSAATVNQNDWLFIDISAITGTPQALTVTIIAAVA